MYQKFIRTTYIVVCSNIKNYLKNLFFRSTSQNSKIAIWFDLKKKKNIITVRQLQWLIEIFIGTHADSSMIALPINGTPFKDLTAQTGAKIEEFFLRKSNNKNLVINFHFFLYYFVETCPFWLSLLFSFFCHQVVLLIHLVLRWTRKLNLRPRTMAQTLRPRRSPLDQGASPKKIVTSYLFVGPLTW